MSYLNYQNKYPTIIKYKAAQNTFNDKLSQYLALEDKYNKLVKSELRQADWKTVPGKLQKVVATGNSNVWGYNSSGSVYTCDKPCKDGKWTKTEGTLKDITGDGSTIYGIGTTNYVYAKPQNNSAGWTQLGSKNKFDKITSNNSNSIIGLKNSIAVKLRITLQCSGGHATYDLSPVMNLASITLKNGSDVVYSAGKGMRINNGSPSTVEIDFNTSTTTIDSIIIGINNTTHNVHHGTWDFDTENPFKKHHVGFETISSMRIETITANATDVLYNSGLNIGTSGGNNNHSISFGNGLTIGHSLFHCTKPCGDENWLPINTKMQLKSISADENYVYGVDTKHALWRCSGNCTSGNWEKDPVGSAINVDASGKRALRVIGIDNMLWERDKDKWGQPWTPTNKVLSETSMANTDNEFLINEDIEGRLWTIDTNDNIGNVLRPPYQQWRTEKNRNATVDLESVNKKSTDDWDYIGDFTTYDGCKFASLNAKKPYNKITYFNTAYNNPNLKNTCWGNKLGKKYKNKSEPNAITGYPPYGYTQLGGLEGFTILHQMKKLNKELIQRAMGLEQMTIPNNETAQKMIKQKTAASEKMKGIMQNLKKDHHNIGLLEKQNEDLISRGEASELTLTQKQSAYIGLGLVMITLVFITAKQMRK